MTVSVVDDGSDQCRIFEGTINHSRSPRHAQPRFLQSSSSFRHAPNSSLTISGLSPFIRPALATARPLEGSQEVARNAAGWSPHLKLDRP
jgi:hypothetical protein